MRVRVYLNHLGSRIPVGILAQTEQGILSEYHSEFLECGIPLSPYFLPLRPGIFFDERQTFDGLFGVFNDSLPDGWGLLLFDRARSKKGRSLAQASPLERLTLVGSCAMGALEYEPDASADEDGTPQPWSIKFRAQEDRPARRLHAWPGWTCRKRGSFPQRMERAISASNASTATTA